MNVLVLGLGALTAGAIFKAKKPKMVKPTPEVAYAFQRLLDAKLPADKYSEAARIYQDAGLPAESQLLQKRARLAALSPEEKEKVRTAFSMAMASEKPDGIRQVAEALHQIGAVGAGAVLRDHASTVETAAAIAPAAPGGPQGAADESEFAPPDAAPSSDHGDGEPAAPPHDVQPSPLESHP